VCCLAVGARVSERNGRTVAGRLVADDIEYVLFDDLMMVKKQIIQIPGGGQLLPKISTMAYTVNT